MNGLQKYDEKELSTWFNRIFFLNNSSNLFMNGSQKYDEKELSTCYNRISFF